MADAKETLKKAKDSPWTIIIVLILLGTMLYGGVLIKKAGSPESVANDVRGWVNGKQGQLNNMLAGKLGEVKKPFTKEDIKPILINAALAFASLFILLQLSTKAATLFKVEKGHTARAVLMYAILITASLTLSFLSKRTPFYEIQGLSWIISGKVLLNYMLIALLLYVIASFTLLKSYKDNAHATYAIIALIFVSAFFITGMINNPGNTPNTNFIWEQTGSTASSLTKFLWAGEGSDYQYTTGASLLPKYSILRGDHLIVFIFGTILLIWVFHSLTPSLDNNKYHLTWWLSAFLAAQIANSGTTKQSFFVIMYFTALLLTYSAFKKSMGQDKAATAGAVAFMLVETLSRLIGTGFSLTGGSEFFGTGTGIITLFVIGLAVSSILSAGKKEYSAAWELRQSGAADKLKKGKGWLPLIWIAGTKGVAKSEKEKEEKDKKKKALEIEIQQLSDMLQDAQNRYVQVSSPYRNRLDFLERRLQELNANMRQVVEDFTSGRRSSRADPDILEMWREIVKEQKELHDQMHLELTEEWDRVEHLENRIRERKIERMKLG